VRQQMLAHVSELGAYLDARLQELHAKYSIITGTRGLGLMRAFDLAEPRAQEVMDHALAQGVLITNAGPATIRFVPPLIIERADVDEAIAKIDAALAAL
jgi:acetylornithine/succinyldiaminopimelate/putrescine aminotransferase